MAQTQDTSVFFTPTERSLMANELRARATEIRLEIRDYTRHHHRPLDPETREVRLARADTLRVLADDLETGERR